MPGGNPYRDELGRFDDAPGGAGGAKAVKDLAKTGGNPGGDPQSANDAAESSVKKLPKEKSRRKALEAALSKERTMQSMTSINNLAPGMVPDEGTYMKMLDKQRSDNMAREDSIARSMGFKRGGAGGFEPDTSHPMWQKSSKSSSSSKLSEINKKRASIGLGPVSASGGNDRTGSDDAVRRSENRKLRKRKKS